MSLRLPGLLRAVNASTWLYSAVSTIQATEIGWHARMGGLDLGGSLSGTTSLWVFKTEGCQDVALFPRTWARPRPALPSSDGITVCTLGSKELHNSLSAKALESPSVAVSAASLPRQQRGLKKQREGGGLDSYQAVLPDAGAGLRPYSSGSRGPDLELLARAGVGQLQPCLQRTTSRGSHRPQDCLILSSKSHFIGPLCVLRLEGARPRGAYPTLTGAPCLPRCTSGGAQRGQGISLDLLQKARALNTYLIHSRSRIVHLCLWFRLYVLSGHGLASVAGPRHRSLSHCALTDWG